MEKKNKLNKKEMKQLVNNLTSSKPDFKNKLKWEDLYFIDTSCIEDDFTDLEKDTLLDFVNDRIEERINLYYGNPSKLQGFQLHTLEIGNLYGIIIFNPEFNEEHPEKTYIPRLEIVLSKKPSRTFIELNHYGVDEIYDSAYVKEDSEYENND